LSDRFGRRKVLFICAILYALSGILSAIPQTFDQFLVARFASGLGIGASSMICPVYIAEIAPARWRGRFGSLFQLGIVSGIFITLFINALIQRFGDQAWNAAVGWRWMLGAEVVPALLFFIVLFFVIESPRWLLQAGFESEARESLAKIGGKDYADAEIAAVRSVLVKDEGSLIQLISQPRFRRPLLIAISLMAFSQFTGINAIMYYSTKIFATAGLAVDSSFQSSAIIGLVNLVFTFVAIAFVDRLGRRPLLLFGLAIQVLSLALVGWMFQTFVHGFVLLLAILVFIGAFAMALGPVPWIICSEIFPMRVRGRAMSVATFVIWSSCYVVAQTFPMLNDNPQIGPAKTFWVFGFFSLVAFFFVLLVVKETKGRSLEEIELE
jgi:SP family arabinose:H+ symporter-like MFS transporter